MSFVPPMVANWRHGILPFAISAELFRLLGTRITGQLVIAHIAAIFMLVESLLGFVSRHRPGAVRASRQTHC